MTEQTAPPPISGYQPPALAIRATYTAGDASDEITVEVDRWDGDPTVITDIIHALTARKTAAQVDIAAPSADPASLPHFTWIPATGEEARA